MRAKRRLGLVLSGGGACGAYEVGVIRVLSRWGLVPQVISGASIGALNGAILASTPRFRLAPSRLETLWEALDPDAIIRLRHSSEDRPNFRSNQDEEVSEALTEFPASFPLYAQNTDASPPKTGFAETFALLDEGPIASLLSKVIDFKRLKKGPDFYISIFPGKEDPGLLGAIHDLVHWFLADRKSEFLRVQDYDDSQIMTLLKASAAIPLAFKPQSIGGRIYRDGGIGVQGNTPIEPLANAGCTHGIVVYLDHRFPLKPENWPNTQLIEIRPSQNLQEDGILRAILDFSPERIRELIMLGEEDALNNPDLRALKKEFGVFRRVFSSLGWS